MKKYLYNIVIATLILMSATVVKAANEVYYTNKYNIEMTEQEYHNLLELGFTEKQIESMDEEIFLENKDISATLVDKTSKYYMITTEMRNGIKHNITREITKEEAMQEKERQSQNLPNRGASGNYYDGYTEITSVFEVVNYISNVSNSYMRYKADAFWVTMPSTSERYADILGIGIEPSKVQISSIIVFRENWVTSDDVSGYTTVCAPKTESTGGSVQMQLPSGSLNELSSYIYFNVSKKSGVGTITSLYISGDYAHSTANYDPNTIFSNYTVDLSAGIDVYYPYSSDYISPNPAYASFIGTW